MSDEQPAALTTGSFPIIATPDLARSLAFYAGVLGGVVGYRFPPDGDAAFVSLDLGSGHLGLGQDPEAVVDAPAQRFSLWVYTTDCDATVERVRASGARVTVESRDEPWGERVAQVLDPDGNLVVVGQAAPAAGA